MSTKVQIALGALAEALGDDHPVVAEAQAEWNRVAGAARTLDRLSVGDYTDDIHDRDHVIRETPDGESTWNHPDVIAWSDASVTMTHIAKETE